MWRLALVLAAAAVLAPAPSGGGTAPRELAFARAGNIWTIGADGEQARLLLRNAYSPAWSPDGSRSTHPTASRTSTPSSSQFRPSD